jgi:hypothetical protein
MRSDIDSVKSQMAQILEKLSELGQKEKEVTPQNNIAESNSQGMSFVLTYPFGFQMHLTYQIPPHPTIESPEVQWPQYGLPPGYTPPTAQDSQIAQSSRSQQRENSIVDPNPLLGFIQHLSPQNNNQGMTTVNQPTASQLQPNNLGNQGNPSVLSTHQLYKELEGGRSKEKLESLEERL